MIASEVTSHAGWSSDLKWSFKPSPLPNLFHKASEKRLVLRATTSGVKSDSLLVLLTKIHDWLEALSMVRWQGRSRVER